MNLIDFFAELGRRLTFFVENGFAFIPGSWRVLHQPSLGSNRCHAYPHSMHVHCWTSKSNPTNQTYNQVLPGLHSRGKLYTLIDRIGLIAVVSNGRDRTKKIYTLNNLILTIYDPSWKFDPNNSKTVSRATYLCTTSSPFSLYLIYYWFCGTWVCKIRPWCR